MASASTESGALTREPGALTRWNPFREMTSLRDAMNRLVDTSMVPWSIFGDGGAMTFPPVDMSETENEYIIEASLPGIKPDEVKISLQNNVLTIEGERKEERERKEGERTIYREHRYGSFTRSFSLPSPVEADKAEARFENGVLRLILPKAESSKPKQIHVQSR